MLTNLMKQSAIISRRKIVPGDITVKCRSIASNIPNFETLAVSVPKPYVFHVELNRPEKMNSFSNKLWAELKECFDTLSANGECRVVVLSGRGKHFTAGVDLMDFSKIGMEMHATNDVARKAKISYGFIEKYQKSISSLEECSKPVISVVHSACVGAGVDLITSADIRYCTEDAWFQVKEVDVGLAADVGTLQRLPKVIGNGSIVRELCFTARKVDAMEAVTIGLVSKVFQNKDSAIDGAISVAETIASKSPVAVQTTKKNLVYSQSRPNEDGLEHIKLLNQTMLQSEDLFAAVQASLSKEKAVFENL